MRARTLVATGLVAAGVAVAAAVAEPSARAQSGGSPAPARCEPGGAPVTFTGSASAGDAKTYLALPFEVADGTTRVEVTYDWSNPALPLPLGLNSNVFDLGLWDADGLGTADGFRGWSGSRVGRRSGQPPVYVQQDVAERGYRPGVIEPGTWWVDLGIAAIDPLGPSTWDVAVTCTAPAVGAPFVPDPVDPSHVADASPGWYHGDFHMHGVHSNLDAPDWQAMVDEARAVGLDFLPITDYVTGQHWDELGAVQRANPDELIIPGREIITYYGHANAIGETRSVLDYRHGFEGVSLLDIQDRTLADGALFQVNHPTIWPGPAFANFCRGCEFTLGSVIDWDRVDTMEVLTGPASVSPTELGLPDIGLQGPNPFMVTALLRWQELLLQGHRITAVSGSDSKGVEGEARRRWGSSATAVFADELSRDAIFEAVRAGHAYVRTLGVDRSPAIELTAVAPDGTTAMMGDTLVATTAQMTVTVTGGAGQLLLLTRDGLPWLPLAVPITSDPFTYSWTADRSPLSGPLGTFWRVDVVNAGTPSLLTVISNPIFLADQLPAGPSGPSGPSGPGGPGGPTTTLPTPSPTTVPGLDGGGAGAGGGGGRLPATGPEGVVPVLPLVAALAAVASLAARTASRRLRTCSRFVGPGPPIRLHVQRAD